MITDEASDNQEELFIGRDDEINRLVNNVNNSDKSVTLLTGELGVGKSALLDEFYSRLIGNGRFFVGYYSHKEALVANSESLDFPFRVALSTLAIEAKKLESLSERIESTLTRVKKGLIKTAKEQGVKLGLAIIEDLARKVGFEETLEVGKEVLKAVGTEKNSLMLAESYVAEHSSEALQSYLDIFKAIANEFKDRRFVLMFDEFEYLGKASIDFFLNFVSRGEKFHIIVSFTTDDRTWNDPSTRKLYEDSRDILIDKLGGKELRLEGLSVKEIGEWIKLVRGTTIPEIPYLHRIRENSGGLPLLLREWIDQSKDLKDYEDIKRDQVCERITRLASGLSDEDKIRLYQMAILRQPLKDEKLANYLQIQNVDLVMPFIERLVERGIFQEDNEWFRHELVRRCIEDKLNKERRIRFHNRAAEFYLNLSEYDSSEDRNSEMKISNYEKSIGLAYHCHHAGRHEESYEYNRRLAKLASNYGNLDVAERCYLRAIIDSEELGRIDEKMKCKLDLSRNVYMYWKKREEEAKNNYDNVLEYSVLKGDYNLHALVLLELVNYYDMIRNNYHEASVHLDDYMKIIQQQSNNELRLAVGYYQKATLLKKQRKYDQAIEDYINSLELFRKRLVELKSQEVNIQYETRSVDIPLYLYQSMYHIGDIHRVRRQYDQALELFNNSLSIAKNLGNSLAIAEALDGIGTVYYEQGDYDKALKKYEERLTIEEKIYHHVGIALTIGYIGRVYIRKNMYEQAREYLQRACLMLKEVDRSEDVQKFQEDLQSIESKRSGKREV